MTEHYWGQVEDRIELRSLPERIVSGRVLPIGRDHRIHPGLVERFLPGAFRASARAAHRVQLRVEHRTVPSSQLIGRAVALDERDGWLVADLKIVDGEFGDRYLNLAAERALSTWSAGFIPEQVRQVDGVEHVVKARLFEVAFTAVPAYADAELLAVREHDDTPDPDPKATVDHWRQVFAPHRT